MDPTPGAAAATQAERGAEAVERTSDRSWSARLGTLRVFWYRRVVNFDARQQVELAETVRSATTGAGDALRARLEALGKRVKAWLAGPWDLARLGRTALGALLVVAAIAALLRVARALAPFWQRWRRPGEFDPVRDAAGRWLRRLAEVGALQAGGGQVRADLERLRYGPRETWPEPEAVFKRARAARRG